MRQFAQVAVNGKPFPKTVLEPAFGKIPEGMSGRYFRNGPGLLYENGHLLTHWFMGPGFIVSLLFKDNQCEAQADFVRNPNQERVKAEGLECPSLLKLIWRSIGNSLQSSRAHNPSNTSVLPLRNSQGVLALCEAGQPFEFDKDTLKPLRGFMRVTQQDSSYSAHPKVDPANGHIYNIGSSDSKRSTLCIMEHSAAMELIKQSQIQLQYAQSIHDFALAGDFLVIVEAPYQIQLTKLLSFNDFFGSHSWNPNLKANIHILRKSDLSLVRSIPQDPFYSYHFTNGYSQGNKVTIEMCKYSDGNQPSLFNMVRDFPKLSLGVNLPCNFTSTLDELTIYNDSGHIATKSVAICGQFPLCLDSEVGSKWRYTYMCTRKPSNIVFHELTRWDRQAGTKVSYDFGEGNYVSEPAIVHNNGKVYLMSITTHDGNSFVSILESSQDQLKLITELPLPQITPPSFHGRWEPL